MEQTGAGWYTRVLSGSMYGIKESSVADQVKSFCHRKEIGQALFSKYI
jgi:hypothetical protein